MDWYYAEGKERRGPVGDAEVATLVKSNVIRPDTLVWNKSLPSWQSAATVGLVGALPAGTQLCIVSGKAFPTSQMIQTEHGWVSAEARDTYYQCLREGVPFSAHGVGANAAADGNKIVVPLGSPRLPMRCVKTNQPLASGEVTSKTLYWCTPAVYLSILLSLIVLLILYLILRKSVKLDIPLSAAGKAAIRKQGFIAAGVLLGGILLAISPAFFDGPMGSGGAGAIIVGILFMLGGLIYAGLKACALRVTKIDGNRVWLAGAGPEYLASLPTYAR